MGAFIPKNSNIDWKSMNAGGVLTDVREAINIAKGRLEKIKAEENPTCENCLLAFDSATDELDTAWNLANHLESVADEPALRAAINEAIPEVSGFLTSIYLDGVLFEKISSFANSEEGKSLRGSKERLLEEVLKDFKSNGAGLPPEKKERLREIDRLLALKTQKFSENALDATEAWKMPLYEDSDMEGIPEHARKVAEKKAEDYAAANPGERPKYVITLEQPSMVPFMTYSERDELRKRVYEAFDGVGRQAPWSNEGLISEILELRDEYAKILGFDNFADCVLSRRMARSGERAEAFVEDLRARYLSAFESEWRELEDFAAKNGYSSEGGRIEPHSVAFLRQKLREKKYSFNPEDLRPYFEASSVMEGLFHICSVLYGLRIERRERGTFSAWAEDVDMFDMFRMDGEKHLGSFYADLHPRKGKRSGAWMNLLFDGDGGKVGVIAGNLSEGSPSLLSFDDVETLFHEFGHLVHFFMMDSPEKGLREVAWDFVELPSQIMENWCKDRKCLDIFARHWKTGEAIPDGLFERFDASRKFMAGNFAMRQLGFAKIDLALHIRPKEFLGDVEGNALCELKPYSQVLSKPAKTALPHFTHIFGDPVGYAAGYYSYKWAEVLSADAFTRFRREGILNPKTGSDFAEKILRVGNEIPPEEAFRNFMGRDPDPSALIESTVGDSEE